MAYKEQLKSLTFVAGEDLSDAQYKFVKLSDDDTVVACTAATDLPIGVLQNDPESGQAAEVAVFGTTKAVVNSSASISAGDEIGTDANATAESKTAGTDTDNYAVGICVDGAGTDETASVFINITPNRAA